MKKNYYITFVVQMLFILICVDSFAQKFSLRHITVNDGLPSNETFCVYPKTFGVLYIGTEYGLVEYDGDEFKTIPFKNNRYNGAMVFEIKPDQQNKLWVKTYRDGLFYIENDTLHAFSNNAQLMQLTQGKDIGQMLFDKASNIWLTFPMYKDTLFCVNTKTGSIKPVALTKKGQLKKASYLFYKLGPNTEIVAPLNNVATKNLPSFEIITEQGNKGILLNSTYSKIPNLRPNSYVSNRTAFFIGLGETLFYWNYKTKQLVSKNLGAEIIYLFQDTRKNILVGTRKGAFLFNPTSSQLLLLFNDYLITGILQDTELGYWFTTNNGLVYMPSTDINVMPLLDEKAFNISTIAGYKDRFAFTGNYGKIYVYNNSKIDAQPELLFTQKILSAVPKKMQWLNNNELLYSTSILNVNNQTENWLMAKTAGEILDIEKAESDSFILFAFKRGFARVNRFVSSKNYLPILFAKDFFCRAICEQNGLIYIGTDQGVFVYDKHGGLMPIHHNKINFQVSDIKPIFGNNVIITTRGGGVFLLNKNEATQLSTSDGLSSSFTTKIVVQNDTTFWIGSNRGLNKITGKNKHYKIEKWFTEDGLVSDKITDLTISGEKLFVLTDQGINYFKYNELISREPKLNISLLQLKINNTKRNITDNTLKLKPGDRDMLFEFKIRGWQKRKNLLVRYVLIGAKQVQSQTGGQTISYKDLEPGDYTLEVQVVTAANTKIGAPINYYINIEPHFYETFIFKISIVVTILIIIIMTLLGYVRGKEKARKKKWDYSNAQLEALNLQINPHFLFNALNSIQYLSFNKEHNQLNTFISNLSELLRSILKHAKLNLISLSVELDNVQKYLQLETLRFEKDEFNYTITIDEQLDLKRNFIPPMIIQPIVENALWHGLFPYKKDKFLSVTLQSINNGFEIIVLDKGIGINQSKKLKHQNESTQLKTSLGLVNVKRRMELFENMGYGKADFILQDISETDSTQHGTKATFTFKLNTIGVK